MRLILYSKPGCHLCEGLQEKLEQIRQFPLELEVRDITTRDDWFQAYQYEIPVLFLSREVEPTPNSPDSAVRSDSLSLSAGLIPLPRLSPRASVKQLEQMLQKYDAPDPPK